MFCILCERERGSHRHTSFGLQQGIDAKTNNRKRGYNAQAGRERVYVHFHIEQRVQVHFHVEQNCTSKFISNQYQHQHQRQQQHQHLHQYQYQHQHSVSAINFFILVKRMVLYYHKLSGRKIW